MFNCIGNRLRAERLLSPEYQRLNFEPLIETYTAGNGATQALIVFVWRQWVQLRRPECAGSQLIQAEV
jgi:hypothetical protein